GRRLAEPNPPRNPGYLTKTNTPIEDSPMHRMLSATALLSSLALPLSAQGTDSAASRHHHDDADHAVEGGGTVPAGWTVRADDKGNPKNVKVVTMGKGLPRTLGPASIVYRAED